MSVLHTVGPGRAEMYAGRIACCPLVSHGEHADGTDGRTPDRYITLSDMDAASVMMHVEGSKRWTVLKCILLAFDDENDKLVQNAERHQ